VDTGCSRVNLTTELVLFNRWCAARDLSERRTRACVPRRHNATQIAVNLKFTAHCCTTPTQESSQKAAHTALPCPCAHGCPHHVVVASDVASIGCHTHTLYELGCLHLLLVAHSRLKSQPLYSRTSSSVLAHLEPVDFHAAYSVTFRSIDFSPGLSRGMRGRIASFETRESRERPRPNTQRRLPLPHSRVESHFVGSLSPRWTLTGSAV